MFLLDSNVVIDYLNNKLPDNSNIILDEISNPIISIVTRIELSILPNATPEQEKIMMQFLDHCTILELSEEIVQRVILLRKKHKIRDFDSIIAATALVHKLRLLTNDKDFLNIKNLKVINSYTL
jgi:predicted nucleic acid-binding protein